MIEDLEYAQFVKNTFQELEEYEKNPQNFNSMNAKKFLNELEKW